MNNLGTTKKKMFFFLIFLLTLVIGIAGLEGIVSADPHPGQSVNVVIIGGTTLNDPCAASTDANYIPNGGCLPITGAVGELGDFTFAPMDPSAVSAANLAPFDTAVLNVASTGMGCTTNTLTAQQKADLIAFVGAGKKLIIYDSECQPSVDYSWLPYPFTTANPGPTGAFGCTLTIVENNYLSTLIGDPDCTSGDVNCINTNALGNNTDAVCDMNVMTTRDIHWCLDMSGTNNTIPPTTGPVHTYAKYPPGTDEGLIIYDGLDQDYSNFVVGSAELRKIWVQELQQPFNPSGLPCGTPVVGIINSKPYKAAVANDIDIPPFHMSQKILQFTFPGTNYYSGCEDVLFPPDPRITSDCTDFGYAFLCPSACSEHFKPVKVSALKQPEVCCTVAQAIPVGTVAEIPVIECPAEGTAMISSGNSGEYEWVIGLPKKPEGELNLEIECGVLKPNALSFVGEDAINVCAAITGEPVGPNCTRLFGQYLKNSALPKLEVIAHPGCNNDFKPFHLTALRNPSTYNIVRKQSGALANAQALQVLDGKAGTRIALKACMEKTILVKWPVDGEVNALGEKETALEAGDLIKVRMIVPNANTVDLYCGKYSVTIGGIGELNSLLNDEECDCISDADCQW
jgi:hypothetical protein